MIRVLRNSKLKKLTNPFSEKHIKNTCLSDKELFEEIIENYFPKESLKFNSTSKSTLTIIKKLNNK